ncbi:hypothetical protein LX36DRAFT_465476 [Colletotrichum falcatum]|nr:hypothetical protein LX36DRAFT_465476 [Colletotrichum falcatum]
MTTNKRMTASKKMTGRQRTYLQATTKRRGAAKVSRKSWKWEMTKPAGTRPARFSATTRTATRSIHPVAGHFPAQNELSALIKAATQCAHITAAAVKIKLLTDQKHPLQKKTRSARVYNEANSLKMLGETGVEYSLVPDQELGTAPSSTVLVVSTQKFSLNSGWWSAWQSHFGLKISGGKEAQLTLGGQFCFGVVIWDESHEIRRLNTNFARVLFNLPSGRRVLGWVPGTEFEYTALIHAKLNRTEREEVVDLHGGRHAEDVHQVLVTTYGLCGTGLDGLKVANYCVHFGAVKDINKRDQASSCIDR